MTATDRSQSTTVRSGTGQRTIRRVPGPSERHPVRHRRRRRILELGLAAGVPLALLVLWQLASSLDWIDSRIYPSPSETLGEVWNLWDEGRLWDDVSLSVRRMVIGWGIGSLIGVVLGLVMGFWPLPRAGLEPMLSALYTVPKLALIPVFLAIFGFGEAPIIALIAVTTFFFVWLSTLAAIQSVPEGYRETARALEMSRSQQFRHVLLPAALPQIFVGLRLAAGVSLLMLIGVEFVIGGEGIGYLIEQGRTLFLLEQTYAGIVVAAVLGFLFMFVVKWIGRRLTPWAQDDRSIGAM